MKVEQRILHFAQLAAIAILVFGCYEVLEPFIPAILFAVVVCTSTWPLYLRLRRALWRKPTPAALLMVVLLIVLVIGPTALLGYSLADNVTDIIDVAKAFLGHGPIEPPAWLKDVPMIGAQLNDYWQEIATGGQEGMALFKELLEPARHFLVSAGMIIGQSVLQMVFAAFIGFFFYRDGEAMMKRLRNGLAKLAGGLGEEVLMTIQHSVAGVVLGIFGTALGQAVVAVIGFLVAGVPGAFLLGTATFFLSMVPVGPPLVWGGASIWLFHQGLHGWAIFMVLWGLFVISSIDNFLKPYLISRGGSLPMLLVILGVFGGILAFGFIGIFIGPPILAVSFTLIRLWTAHPAAEAEIPRHQPLPPDGA